MEKTRLHYAWVVLLGVILIRGFAGGGINTTSGLFLAPVSAEIGVGIGTLSLYFSIISVVTVLWLPVAGKLINRCDIRAVAVAGALLQTLSVAALSQMHSVYGWYLLAIPQAMGAAILASLLGPILINRWFARHTGLMLGVQMAFVNLFGAVLQPVTSQVIAARGWRAGYLFIGLTAGAVILLASLFLIRSAPQDKGLRPYGADQGAVGPQKAAVPDALAVPEATALRSASFYLLLLFMVAITGVGVFTQHIPTYSGLLGYTLGQTGRALALASVGNAIGSIAIGLICDRIGCLKTCYLMIAVGIAAILGFFVGGSRFALFGLSAFLHGLVSSSIMVLAPILTIQFFGQRDYEKIYAKVSMGAPLASIVLIPVYGFVYDATAQYGYVLLGMIGLLLLAAFCIAAGWRRRCTDQGCPSWRRPK